MLHDREVFCQTYRSLVKDFQDSKELPGSLTTEVNPQIPKGPWIRRTNLGSALDWPELSQEGTRQNSLCQLWPPPSTLPGTWDSREKARSFYPVPKRKYAGWVFTFKKCAVGTQRCSVNNMNIWAPAKVEPWIQIPVGSNTSCALLREFWSVECTA